MLFPKGVLDHNLSVITSSLAVDTTTVEVSWLPQYHDVRLYMSFKIPMIIFVDELMKPNAEVLEIGKRIQVTIIILCIVCIIYQSNLLSPKAIS